MRNVIANVRNVIANVMKVIANVMKQPEVPKQSLKVIVGLLRFARNDN